MMIFISLQKYITISYQICVSIIISVNNNSNINTSSNFASDGIHLNERYHNGVPELARNLCDSVGTYAQQTNITVSNGITITMDTSDLEKLTLQLLLVAKRDNLMKMIQDCLIIITTDSDFHMIISTGFSSSMSLYNLFLPENSASVAIERLAI